jgi:hypothetical protein
MHANYPTKITDHAENPMTTHTPKFANDTREHFRRENRSKTPVQKHRAPLPAG